MPDLIQYRGMTKDSANIENFLKENESMLALSRNVGQKLIIGDDIEIYVSKIHGRHVRLSITAPKDAPIYRKEIFEKIQEQKENNKT